MSGTPYRPDTTGRVLFIECPGRKSPAILMMLDRLKSIGFFDRCAAVVFGTFPECGTDPETMLKPFAETLACPVYTGFPYGHTERNHTIDFRRRMTIDANGLLRVE
ncbi:MAG: hypothetical protein HPZ91_00685 [Lentisphaeria bacterium]|nr:hypothetical protein [Lentisphaeria bacterium]